MASLSLFPLTNRSVSLSLASHSLSTPTHSRRTSLSLPLHSPPQPKSTVRLSPKKNIKFPTTKLNPKNSFYTPFRPVFLRSAKKSVQIFGSKFNSSKKNGDFLSWAKGNMWRNLSFSGGERAGREKVCEIGKKRASRGRKVVKAPPKARLFGPAIFEAHKLRVLFLNVEEDRHPADAIHGPRTYTLTHSDVTSKLTLAVAREFNKAQFAGWYSRLQRDEVLAVWRAATEAGRNMALHVHCHISGGHFLLDTIARLRFWIFRKELPVVIEAFRHGDRALFQKHPDLEESLVWVHFHSNIPEFNKKECWGPLATAAKKGMQSAQVAIQAVMEDLENVWPAEKSISTGNLIPRPIFPDDIEVEVIQKVE